MPKECEALGSCQRPGASGRLQQIFVSERRSAGGGGRWLECVRAPLSTTGTYWVTTFRRLWDGNDGEDGKAHAQDLHFCGGTVITGCNCPTHILSGDNGRFKC